MIENENFSEEVKQSTEHVIVDTLISILYGLKTEPELQAMMTDRASKEGLRVLGTDYNLPKKDALIALGTAAVANELDEGNTFAKGHPSAHIFPVVYICALENEYTWEEVIGAYAKGYEISARLSQAFQMKDDMHPHGTWGNAGGAVTRAILEEKSAEDITDIILLSLSLPIATSWLAAEKGQSVRNLYTGYGNLLAYDAVDLVSYGFKSNETVAEDLWSGIMGEGVDLSKLSADPDGVSMISKNYFKVHPTCRFTHASIEAAKEIMEQYKLSPEKIKTVQVSTYDLAARCDSKLIRTRLESKFSIPYAVAAIILGLDLYDDYSENLRKMGAFIDKIEVIEDKAMTALLPQERAAKCTITDMGGVTYSAFIPNAKGEYSNPFTESEFKMKYENMLQRHYSFFSEGWLNGLLNIDRTKSFTSWLIKNHLLRRR
ncbi:MmgE/PrpD family protein [Salinicoccus kekensis]|uniref:MmgE/PrpD family protein n=1 Tax=Salinicoccus kekensis TaxID=714307 RepID=UPI0015CCFBD3|nr:MmgE/PrpD family protein [Salinicoccus kekensis]